MTSAFRPRPPPPGGDFRESTPSPEKAKRYVPPRPSLESPDRIGAYPLDRAQKRGAIPPRSDAQPFGDPEARRGSGGCSRREPELSKASPRSPSGSLSLGWGGVPA